MSFTYVYNDMLLGYHNEKNNQKYFDNDDNIICFFISSTKKYETASKKHKKHMSNLEKKQGYLGAFVKQNIERDNIRKLKFIDDNQIFPNGRIKYPLGLYYIFNSKLKQLFIVFPTPKRNANNQDIISGDHYSFVYNKNDTKQVHLHRTEYIPQYDNINQGSINHVHYHFSDNITLPSKGYDCSVFDNAILDKNDILDLCRFHMTKELNGGARKKTKSSYRTNDISKSLERALLTMKIKEVKAIGYKQDNKWHVTVEFTWVEEEDKNIDDTDTDVESTDSEDYSETYKHDIAFIIDNPRFSTFQKELTKRLTMM